MPKIILASSSTYRAQLIKRLGLEEVNCIPADIDETAKPGESAQDLCLRLAIEKARKIAKRQNDNTPRLIIGADQTAVLDGDTEIIGKPLTAARAIAQLQKCSGKTLRFYTGLCLINTTNDNEHAAVEAFSVTFRHLSTQQITHYVEKEQPLDCAGSFKSEGLGISLFSAMTGSDPNTLIGLPLIRLCDMLIKEGAYPLD